ncbi:MAG: BON domain-containing protein [Bdellovibrionota bacterium]
MNRTSLKLSAIVLLGFSIGGFRVGAQAYTTAPTEASNPSVLDQSSGTTQDVEVTRLIREELGKNDSFSTSAKNIEVITLNNTVTLKGSVATQNERTQLINVAQRVAGNRAVRNEITVDTTRR